MAPPTKDVTVTVRVSTQMKKTLESEARKDKRKLSQLCEILLGYGLREHIIRKATANKTEVAA
jgi:hypothetical protein